MFPYNTGVHIPSGDKHVLHLSSRNGGTARISVLVLQELILGTRGDIRRLATEGSSEGCSIYYDVPVTLSRNGRAFRSKTNVLHNTTGDLVATYGK